MKTCIHTVIKDELDEYLKVWLDHHTKMVDHIFIFEDVGSHSHKHVIDQYDNVSLMSVFDLYQTEDGKKRLINAKEKKFIMQNQYILYGVTMIQELNEYDWCFCLDIDEFITLEDGYEVIPDVLREFQDHDAILLQWMNYGANGHITKPNYEGRDYREFYTTRGEDSNWDGKLKANTKIVFNLNRITKWHLCGVHCCVGNWVKTNFSRQRASISYDKIYLKHYPIKSFEEYLWKLYIRGMHCGKSHRKVSDFFEMDKSMLVKYDECMKFKEKFFKDNNINS